MCLITFIDGSFMKILYEDILLTYNKIKPFLKITESNSSYEDFSLNYVSLKSRAIPLRDQREKNPYN